MLDDQVKLCCVEVIRLTVQGNREISTEIASRNQDDSMFGEVLAFLKNASNIKR